MTELPTPIFHTISINNRNLLEETMLVKALY